MKHFKFIVYLGIGTNYLLSQQTIEKKLIYFPMDKRLIEKKVEINPITDSLLLETISKTPFYKAVYTEKDLSYASKEHYYFPIENLLYNNSALVDYQPAYIPNIYSNTKKIVYNRKNNLLEITMPTKHQLTAGDYVMLENKEGTKLECKIEEVPNEFTFSIKNDIPKSDSYFVRGKKVNDLQHIDREELLLLNMRINQLLNNKITVMENKVVSLSRELQFVKNLLNKLKK